MKIVVLAAATVLFASGCVSMPSKLSDAAERLDKSADALYDEVRLDDRNRALQRDAQVFADVADDFHRDVQERVDNEELRDRFDRMSSRYHALRDEFGDELPRSRERAAFNEVTRAYLDLERELRYTRTRAYNERDERRY